MSRLYRGTLVVALILLLAACGKDEGFTLTTIPSSFLRIMNAIPDSPQLNTYVNTRLVQSVNFGLSSTFLEVLPDINLRFSVDYAADNQLVSLISNAPLHIDLNHDHTIVLAGSMDNPQLIEIDNPPGGETIADGMLEIQFMNATDSLANPILVTLTSAGATVQTATLDFKEVTGRLTVAPGDYRMTLKDSVSNAVLWDGGDFTLSEGLRGLFVIVDYFGPSASGVRMLGVGEASALTFPNESLPTEMRIANMTSDQGPLDVYVDDVLFSENVAFGEVTDFESIAGGEVTIVVTPTGQPDTVLSTTESLTLEPGLFYETGISGIADSNNIQLSSFDARRIATRSFLNVVNATRGFPSFDIYVLEAGASVNNAFPVSSSVAQIPSSGSTRRLAFESGSFDFVVTEFSTKTIVFGPQRIDLVTGGLYSIYLTNAAGGGDTVEFVLGDDFE